MKIHSSPTAAQAGNTLVTVVIIGGVCVSTLFSLIVVPCLYDIMAPDKDRSQDVLQAKTMSS